jgi:hypothetical protein
MKKWMQMVLIGTFTAGLAVAETNKLPWYKKMFNKSADETVPAIEPAASEVAVTAPAVIPDVPKKHRPELTPEQIEKMKARREKMQQGKKTGDRPHMTPEQMEKMKAMHEELMKLGEAARTEADPVKKEALVGELRTKLTAIADRIQAKQKKRLEQAGKEMEKLKKRIADYEANKSARIEEQIQRILAGEPLRASGEGPHKKGPKPPSLDSE